MGIYIRTRSFLQVLVHFGIVVCIFVLLGVLFFSFYLPLSTNFDDTVEVPSLVGSSVQDLEARMREQGVTMVIKDSAYNANYKPFTVLSQYPVPKERVKKGRKIYLVVSPKLPPMIKMPNLKGMSYIMAMTRLRQNNLELGKIRFRPDIALDDVLQTETNGKNIEKDMPIRMGASVDLLVGEGLGDIDMYMPNLIGMTKEDVVKALEPLELQMGSINFDTESDKPAGTVTRQNPPVYIEIEDEDNPDKIKKLATAQNNEDDDVRIKKKKGGPVHRNMVRAGEIVDIWIAGKKTK